MFSTTVGK